MLLRYNQHNSQQTSNNFCYFHTHFCWVQGQKTGSLGAGKGGGGQLGHWDIYEVRIFLLCICTR